MGEIFLFCSRKFGWSSQMKNHWFQYAHLKLYCKLTSKQNTNNSHHTVSQKIRRFLWCFMHGTRSQFGGGVGSGGRGGGEARGGAVGGGVGRGDERDGRLVAAAQRVLGGEGAGAAGLGARQAGAAAVPLREELAEAAAVEQVDEHGAGAVHQHQAGGHVAQVQVELVELSLRRLWVARLPDVHGDGRRVAHREHKRHH